MAASLDKSSGEMENLTSPVYDPGDEQEQNIARDTDLDLGHNGISSMDSSLSESFREDPDKSIDRTSEKSNGTPGRKQKSPRPSPCGSTPGSSKVTSPTKSVDIAKQKEREEKIRIAKEKAAEERKKKLMELKEQHQRQAEFRKKQEEERKRKLTEAKRKEDDRRRAIEERRRRIMDEENKKLQAILKRSAERDAKMDNIKSRRSASSYAFGSRTPRMQQNQEVSPGIGRRAQSHGSLLRKAHNDTSMSSEENNTSAMTRSLHEKQRATSVMNVSRRSTDKNRSVSAPPPRSKSADVRRSRVDLQKTFDRLSQPKPKPKPSEDGEALNTSKNHSKPPRSAPSPRPVKLATTKPKQETPKKEEKKPAKKEEPPKPKAATPKAEKPKAANNTKPAPKKPVKKEEPKAAAPKPMAATKEVTPTKGPLKAVHKEPPKPKAQEEKAKSPATETAPSPAKTPDEAPASNGTPALSAEEEYKLKLAEKRREAREKAQREAEEKKRQEEERQREEEERIRKEQEEERRMMEEQQRLAEVARKAEEERLQKAIEAEEQRRREEEERKEREKKEKEEAEKKAAEEAEKREQERVIKLQKEEEERQARKKRLEMIMKRVKTDDNKSDSSPSPSKANVSPPGCSTPDSETADEEIKVTVEEPAVEEPTETAAPAPTPAPAPISAAPVLETSEPPATKFKSPLLQKMMARNKEVKSAESSDDEGRTEVTKVVRTETETTKVISRDDEGNISQQVVTTEETKVITRDDEGNLSQEVNTATTEVSNEPPQAGTFPAEGAVVADPFAFEAQQVQDLPSPINDENLMSTEESTIESTNVVESHEAPNLDFEPPVQKDLIGDIAQSSEENNSDSTPSTETEKDNLLVDFRGEEPQGLIEPVQDEFQAFTQQDNIPDAFQQQEQEGGFHEKEATSLNTDFDPFAPSVAVPPSFDDKMGAPQGEPLMGGEQMDNGVVDPNFADRLLPKEDMSPAGSQNDVEMVETVDSDINEDNSSVENNGLSGENDELPGLKGEVSQPDSTSDLLNSNKMVDNLMSSYDEEENCIPVVKDNEQNVQLADEVSS